MCLCVGSVCSITPVTSVLCLRNGVQFNFMLIIFLNLLLNSRSQLLINVQNQGGEVIQESITSNVSEDIITLEFQKTDGTLITQVIDFRNAPPYPASKRQLRNFPIHFSRAAMRLAVCGHPVFVRSKPVLAGIHAV
uniref:Out at first protein n=1 Tax=Bactrocera latifrons TaxID=174628 RepID=A0A0K8WDQ9_BACLA